jgi:uncharacterized protein
MADDEGRVHLGAMRVELHLPGIDSLKGKRALLNRAKAALRSELECSVAEVGWQDKWQRAALGIAVAASTAGGAERVLDRVRAVIERDPRVIVTATSELVDVLDTDSSDGVIPPGWS